MPIPDPVMARLKTISIEALEPPHSVLVNSGAPCTLPNAFMPGGWVICPGLYAENDGADSGLHDLDHRLRQAKLLTSPVWVLAEGQKHAARFVHGMSRAKAVAFGYKLRHWAVFEVQNEGFLVVYTGHNSRAR